MHIYGRYFFVWHDYFGKTRSLIKTKYMLTQKYITIPLICLFLQAFGRKNNKKYEKC